MKKIFMLLSIATACSIGSLAQSVINVFNSKVAQSTVEVVPGAGEYVMSETVFHPNPSVQDRWIHFVHYDQAGNVIPTHHQFYGDYMYDERNVDLTHNSDNGEYLITATSRPATGWKVNIWLIRVDVAGNMISNKLIESNDPLYKSLYPLDAVYDHTTGKYLISGTATVGGNDIRDAKVAFVAVVDANLNINKIMFYDSDPGLSATEDYDMAGKVVVIGSGQYYVTGSSNIAKNIRHAMGIRNMVIDANLNPVWDIPLQINDSSSQENGVDMVSATDNSGVTNYFLLVNSTLNKKWRYVRIDPATLLPVAGTKADALTGYDSYGFSMHVGNNTDEIVISGMKYRYDGDCTLWDGEATPFMATIDISNPSVGLMTSHVEYNTVFGSSTYWGLSDFYGTPNLYPVPSYQNNFADREAPGSPYSVVTPVNWGGGSLVTKYLDVDNLTNNGCDDINCVYDTDLSHRAVAVYPVTTATPTTWITPTKNYTTAQTSLIGSRTCSQGQYKDGNTTDINKLNTDRIGIYPNPATTSITVELGNTYYGKFVQIRLCDATGKQVALLHNGNILANSIKLELSDNVTTGMYLLQIHTIGKETIIEKITVNK